MLLLLLSHFAKNESRETRRHSRDPTRALGSPQLFVNNDKMPAVVFVAAAGGRSCCESSLQKLPHSSFLACDNFVSDTHTRHLKAVHEFFGCICARRVAGNASVEKRAWKTKLTNDFPPKLRDNQGVEGQHISSFM